MDMYLTHNERGARAARTALESFPPALDTTGEPEQDREIASASTSGLICGLLHMLALEVGDEAARQAIGHALRTYHAEQVEARRGRTAGRLERGGAVSTRPAGFDLEAKLERLKAGAVEASAVRALDADVGVAALAVDYESGAPDGHAPLYVVTRALAAYHVRAADGAVSVAERGAPKEVGRPWPQSTERPLRLARGRLATAAGPSTQSWYLVRSERTGAIGFADDETCMDLLAMTSPPELQPPATMRVLADGELCTVTAMPTYQGAKPWTH